MAMTDAFESAPRAYRPTYSYRYGPNFPPSTSMTLAEPWPSHYVAPPPMTDFPTDLATHRRERAEAIAASVNRRRTDNAFPVGHSAPTVANSRLTASVSGSDISQPTPKPQRLRFPNLRRDSTPTGSKPKLSRIPTPVHGKSAEGKGRRYVSTPLLPIQKTKKENVQPLRLLGLVSPTRQQAPMQKSRTMVMLSSLTSSFSRSNISLSNSRQVSTSSARTSDPTISVSSTSSPPLPTFTTNIRQIHTAHPSAYWCGRFQSLSDRFETELFDLALSDSTVMARYCLNTNTHTPTPDFSSLSNITNIANNSRYQPKPHNLKARANPQHSFEVLQEMEGRNANVVDRIVKEETERRAKRILLHLEAFCVTNDAKKSLWEWQLAYARTQRNEKYLPQGGRMVGEQKGGWVSRMGRAIGGGASGTLSSLGRHSGLGALRKKGSVLGLSQKAQAQGQQAQRQKGYAPLGEIH